MKYMLYLSIKISSVEFVMSTFQLSQWKQIVDILFSLYFQRQLDTISMEDLYTEDAMTGKHMYKIIDW